MELVKYLDNLFIFQQNRSSTICLLPLIFARGNIFAVLTFKLRSEWLAN